MVNLGHSYKVSVYQLLKVKQKCITSDKKTQRGHESDREQVGQYLSELISHEEGRGIGFWLHVGHMGSSGGIDMVGRKHLQ